MSSYGFIKLLFSSPASLDSSRKYRPCSEKIFLLSQDEIGSGREKNEVPLFLCSLFSDFKTECTSFSLKMSETVFLFF